MNKLKLLISLIFLLNISSSVAFTWDELWTKKDRIAYNLFMKEKYKKAGEKFEDLHWKGISEIRDGDYAKSVKSLSSIDNIEAKYNSGNAYAYNNQHSDARFNLEVVKKIEKELKKQQQNNKNNKQCKNPKNSKNAQNNKSNSQKQQSKSSKNGDKQNSPKNQNESQKQKSNANNKQQNKPKENLEQNKEKKSQAKEDKRKKEQQANQSIKEKKQQKKDKKEDLSTNSKYNEQMQAEEQWLRSISDDPGGLLKQKFIRDHLRRQGKQV